MIRTVARITPPMAPRGSTDSAWRALMVARDWRHGIRSARAGRLYPSLLVAAPAPRYGVTK